MNIPLLILGIISVSLVAATSFPNGGVAALIIVILSFFSILIIRRNSDGLFLTNVFLLALILRVVFGWIIFSFDLIEFFGGDQNTYDFFGQKWVDIQLGLSDTNDIWAQRAISTSGPGWGMYRFVGVIYLLFGRSILIGQAVCIVVGAATSPMVYFCAKRIFKNVRAAKIVAVAVALFPSFIIWSSQLLKDGLIIFLLVFSMTAVLILQEKLVPWVVVLLVMALFGIMALRFYVFYMVAAAILGTFVIGASRSNQSIVKRLVVLTLIGLSLTYLGLVQTANSDLENYASLEFIESSRSDSATFNSGYGLEADVSTPAGAIAFLPTGFLFLMLAPFPWQVSNFRQLLTLPEMFVWWSLIPFLFSGLAYTLKNRLREALPILIFTLMLTLVYSISQGNVGNAYRQRAQIQVFLLVFISVGVCLRIEKTENRRSLRPLWSVKGQMN